MFTIVEKAKPRAHTLSSGTYDFAKDATNFKRLCMLSTVHPVQCWRKSLHILYVFDGVNSHNKRIL